MSNKKEYEQIHQALVDATSGISENPFLYERIMVRLTKGEPVVKKKISFGIVLIIILAAITVIGLATGVLFGQEWYMKTRNGLETAAPEKYAAIKSHLTVPVDQSNTENNLVDMTVQDVAWVPEQKVMTVSVRATLKNADHYELYPFSNLDTDGSYVGSAAITVQEEEGEDRAEHWLWRNDADSDTEPRHGLPSEMMDDPDKALLLIESGGILLRDPAMLNTLDEMRLSDGSCLFYYEFNLDRFDTYTGGNKQDEEILAITYMMPYRIVAFNESITDDELYMGGENGTFTFTVTTK